MRNVDRSFNKEGPIENTVEVNIYYQGHRERTEIDVIEGQKWSVILGMPWLVLWQPLDTQGPMISLTSKPQRRSIMWGIHKRTRQGVSS